MFDDSKAERHQNVAEMDSSQKVIVVGAGPVGLFTALKLAQADIAVELIEKENAINENPRAAGYYGGASLALKDAGVLNLMAEKGYLASGLCWRKPPVADGKGGKAYGEMIAHIPFGQGSEAHPEKGMLILPQSELCKLLLKEIVSTGCVKVQFGTELCAIRDDGDRVTATVKIIGLNSTHDIVGSFLVGADGGRSTTRKLLGIRLLGHTWPERLIATDVLVHNDQVPKFAPHFIIDPINFAVIIPLTQPVEGRESLWRYTIAVDQEDTRSDEEILSEASINTLYEKVMAGPRPLTCTVQRKVVYRTHQRLATTMRRGRCALAGDAAHLNNPMGALGLTTGLLDSEALSDALKLVLKDGIPWSVLDVYSDERRKVFQYFVDPTSTQNQLRLAQDPNYAGEDWFLRLMKDPTSEAIHNYIMPFFATWRTNIRGTITSKGISKETVKHGESLGIKIDQDI